MKWLAVIVLLTLTMVTNTSAQDGGSFDLGRRSPHQTLAAQLADGRLVYLFGYSKEMVVGLASPDARPSQRFTIDLKEKGMRDAEPVALTAKGDTLYVYTYDRGTRGYGCLTVDLTTEEGTFEQVRTNSKAEQHMAALTWGGDAFLITVLEESGRMLVRKVSGSTVSGISNHLLELPGFFVRPDERQGLVVVHGLEASLPMFDLSQLPDLIDLVPQFKMYQDGPLVVITDDQPSSFQYQVIDLTNGRSLHSRKDVQLDNDYRHREIVGNSCYYQGKFYRLTGSAMQMKITVIDLETGETEEEFSILAPEKDRHLGYLPKQALSDIYRGDLGRWKPREVDMEDFFQELHRGQPSIIARQTEQGATVLEVGALRMAGPPLSTSLPGFGFSLGMGGAFGAGSAISAPWSTNSQRDEMRITYLTLYIPSDAERPEQAVRPPSLWQQVSAYERKAHRGIIRPARTVLRTDSGEIIYGYYSGKKEYALEAMEWE